MARPPAAVRPATGKTAARSITVRVQASRKGAEALRLGIRRLAACLGLPAVAVSVRRVGGGRRPGGSEG